MRLSPLRLLPLVLVGTVCAAAAQTVTLYPPMDSVTKKYDEGRSCFSFKYGARKDVVKKTKEWELGYGFLAIGKQDWFTLSHFDGSRSVMKDLGELKWEDSFVIPALEPLPEQPKGQPRQITIDSSADTHEAWAKSATLSAKVALSHIYLVRVKDEAADFYVMFRVEEFEQGRHCTISWRLVPSSKIVQKQ
jgi:hypothetical protein